MQNRKQQPTQGRKARNEGAAQMSGIIVDVADETQAATLGIDEASLKTKDSKKSHPEAPKPDLDVIYSMKQAKEFVKDGPVSELNFTITQADNRYLTRDIRGVVLASLVGKKVGAELSCSSPGCMNTHIRQVSDWHQSGFCSTHTKAKGKMSNEEKAVRLQAKAAALLAG